MLVSDYEKKLLIENFGVPASLLEVCRLAYPEPQAPAPFESRAISEALTRAASRMPRTEALEENGGKLLLFLCCR